MSLKAYIRVFRAGAAGAMLALALWSALPALTLALPERVECGMACCLDAGHCCCATRLQAAEEAQPSSPEFVVERMEPASSCPANCATLSSAPQWVAGVLQRTVPRFTPEPDAARQLAPAPAGLHASPAAEPSSPRAPPTLS